MIESEIGSIIRATKFCGDCGREFDERDSYVYPRICPARLICLDCKLKELKPCSSTVHGSEEKT